MRRAKRKRRRVGQTGNFSAELTTPALRATPPLRGGEWFPASCLRLSQAFPDSDQLLQESRQKRKMERIRTVR